MISVSNEYFRLIILYNKWEIGTEVKKDDEQNAYIRLYKMNLLSKHKPRNLDFEKYIKFIGLFKKQNKTLDITELSHTKLSKA